MAIRNVREMGDPVLNKICKEVKEMTPRTLELIDDMFDTMYEEGGVGLAANQVGILKRVVVIDVTGEDPVLLINPVILETSGEQVGNEGCLSVPGKAGVVRRHNYVKVRANDRSRGRSFWPGLSAMRWSILTVIFTWKRWRAALKMWRK